MIVNRFFDEVVVCSVSLWADHPVNLLNLLLALNPSELYNSFELKSKVLFYEVRHQVGLFINFVFKYFMELTESNPEPSRTASGEKLLINKNEVLKALNDLVEHYPSENIPIDVLEKSLAKFLEPRQSVHLKDNEAIHKLDQIIAQYKNLKTF